MITTSATDSLYPAPEDAVTYQLVPSVTMLKTNATRTISTSCTVTAYKIVGNTRTAYNGLVTVWGYDKNGTRRYTDAGDGYVTFSTNTSDSNSALCERFECMLYVTGLGTVAYCTVPVVMDGAKGDSVVNALPVPAGEYDATVTYTNNGVLTPYVLDGSLYYVLKKVGSVTGVRPSVDVAGQGGNWTLIENYAPIFTEILMADLALLGKAVFHGNYMFSQYGKRGSTVINTPGNYSAPTEAGGNFTPNILIDFMTGFFRCLNAEIKGEVNADSGRIGGFEINDNNLESEGDGNISVCLRNNSGKDIYASIGVNTSHVVNLGAGVFRNESTDGSVDSDVNRALYLVAQGRKTNEAIRMDGGGICGMAMRNTFISTEETSHNLSRFDYNVLTFNTGTCTLTLPQMMGYDDGHVIRIKRLGSGSLKVVAQKCYTYNGLTLREAAMPFIIKDQNSRVAGTTGINFSSVCDAMELVWVRDVSQVIDGQTYYGAWVQYKLPRDW